MVDPNPSPRGSRRAAAFLALLIAGAAVGPVAAQQHDLVMFGLSASPNPLERGCTATLNGSFLINGSEDHTLASGAATIQFSWADGASPIPSGTSGWTPAGTVSVTWAGSDGPFAEGREWPTDFPSVAGTGASWTVPTGPTSFHLRAEVSYTGGSGATDGVPTDNVLSAANVPSVAGSCTTVKPCLVGSGGIVICPDGPLVPVEEIHCLLDPDCFKIREPVCGFLPCPVCLSCPPEGWEIFVDLPPELVRLEILDAAGEVVARSRPLRGRRPGERPRAQQVLHFEAKEGVDYGVRLLAGPKARPGQLLEVDVEMIPAGKGGDQTVQPRRKGS